MAVKRKGLGKGLDSLIPENKSVKPAAKAEKEESHWQSSYVKFRSPFLGKKILLI